MSTLNSPQELQLIKAVKEYHQQLRIAQQLRVLVDQLQEENKMLQKQVLKLATQLKACRDYDESQNASSFERERDN